jgi:N-acetylglutamate synthase-like GNAT family acetyltransferase
MKLVPWNVEQQESFLGMQYDAQRDHYRRQFPTADYKVVLLNQEIAGRLYVLREPAANRILDIALLPVMRRRGSGTQLLRGLLREASEAGKPLRVYVETFNPALCLFEQLGFLRIAEEGVNFLLEYKAEPVMRG